MVRKTRASNTECLITAKLLHKHPHTHNKETVTASKVSFQVAHLLVMQRELLTNSKFIKLYLIAVAEESCPEKINVVKTISLLARTVAWRIETIRNGCVVGLKTRQVTRSGFPWLLMNWQMLLILFSSCLKCQCQRLSNWRISFYEWCVCVEKNHRRKYFKRSFGDTNITQYEVESMKIWYSWWQLNNCGEKNKLATFR